VEFDVRVLINGRVRERWGPKEDRDVRFSRRVGASEGRVLSAGEANAAAERAVNAQREKLILWGAAIGLVVVVVVAMIGGGDDGSRTLRGLGVGTLVLAVFVGVNGWRIGARAKERRARLGDGGRLPPAGALVSFDETALTLDNLVIPWASLVVERLIVIETGDDSTDYHVERIEAAAGDRLLLFDLYLYSNGDALVRMAYLKLIRERLPVLKR
jgi:hypothetical protein